ncbi:little elongation complex subunit 2-like isoform X2 [Periplaneta americana]|uniref:little elongation complex subunit 2-like isoform X2 n=1 Tax=Periplaneta americana TaxID=6978 RepID=UPI0037E83121
MEEFLNLPWNVPHIEDNSSTLLANAALRKFSSTYKILHGNLQQIFSDDSDSDLENDERTSDGESKTPQTKAKTSNAAQMKPLQRRKFVPCFPDESKIKYPKASSLSALQQEQYMQLMLKFANKKSTVFVSQTEQKELKQYELLHDKVVAERYEFIHFVKQRCALTQDRYLLINPDVKKYIEETWQHRLSRVTRYPAAYEPLRMLPLVYSDNRKPVSLVVEKDLLELGSIPFIITPNFKKSVRVPTDYSRMVSKIAPDCRLPAWERAKILHKVPVSQDENAEKLALVNGAHIVISSSGLKHIADNHAPGFEKSWDIPIVVKDYARNGSTKKVVYVDKALPRSSLSTMEKNFWFHKFGVKALICHGKHPKCFLLERSNKNSRMADTRNQAPDDASDTNSWKTTDSDENESSSPEMKPRITKCEMTSPVNTPLKRKHNNTELSEDECHNSDITDSEAGLVIDCSDLDISTTKKRSKVVKSSPVTENTEEDSRITRSKARLIAKMSSINKSLGQKPIQFVRKTLPDGDCETQTPRDSEEVSTESSGGNLQTRSDRISMCLRSQQHKDEKEADMSSSIKEVEGKVKDGGWVPPARCTNVSYRLWKMHKHENQKEDLKDNFLKGDSNNREIKIIVRNRVDGHQRQYKKIQRVYVTPKMEYQTEYGAECLTQSELTRNWISLYFRPETHLLRVRVNASTSEVMMVDERSLQEIAQESIQQTGRPNSTVLGTMYNVLLGLVDLEPGHYLLSHTAKLGAFVNLRQSVKYGRFNLHDMYRIDVRAKPVLENSVWIPIDHNVVTPFHRIFNRIPGTFPPVRYVGGKPVSKKKKKKKNKNKKKNAKQE